MVNLVCNGNLGKFFTLGLNIEVEEKDRTNSATFRISLDKTNDISNFTNMKLLENISIELYTDDELLYKFNDTIDLNDFNKGNVYIYNQEYYKTNSSNQFVTVKLNGNKFLDTTIVEDVLHLKSSDIRKLFTLKDITNLVNKDGSFTFKVDTNIDYDLLEYKIDSKWVKLKDTTFHLDQTSNKFYIQARIKKDGIFEYSNVLKLNQ